MPEDEEKTPDDPSTAFPASAATPGQAQSRASHKNLEKLNENVIQKADDGSIKTGYSWWDIYLDLRARKWTWRKAAYIAWSCVPTHIRIPKTQKELATQVLGMRSDRILRKWRENDPEIEKEIERACMALQRDRVPDAVEAWADMACLRHPSAHRDRITFLTQHKIYKPPKANISLSGDPDGSPIKVDLEAEYRKDMADVMNALNPDYDDEEDLDNGGDNE